MFFSQLETLAKIKNPYEKIEQFKSFYDDFQNSNVPFETNYQPYELIEPSYKDYLNIVLPKQVKQRKYFDTLEGKQILLHTIAHIEYSAIDLALDATLRFQNLPKEYYYDWLEVANDEVRHFEMIDRVMNDIGIKYGDFEVHTNLFEAMKNTTTLLERMAIVPRYLEANGLDQNPKIIKKLESNPDTLNLKILELLHIILEEEVDHVRKGDKWFKYACEQENLEPNSTYIELLEKYYPGSTQKNLVLNFEARKKAGFSCDELKRLSNQKECF